jgi:hypothetical protein
LVFLAKVSDGVEVDEGLPPAGGQAWRGRQDGNWPLEADDLDGLVLCRQSVERREELSSQGGGLDRLHALSVRYLHGMANMKRTLF